MVLGSTYTYSITSVARASSYVWTVPTGATILSGQGTNSINVNMTAGLVNDLVTVTPQNACGAAIVTSKKDVGSGGAPVKPDVVYGTMAVCAYLGIGSVTYSITPVSGASSYLWVKPTGATILSGQGTTSITVSFTSSFTSGVFSVASVNGCGTSAYLSFTANKLAPVPVSIANAYGKTNNVTLVNYSTPDIDGVTSYTWTVPANVTIASGQGTTSINVTFAPAFTSGSITVKGINACGAGAAKSKTIANNTTTPLSVFEHTIQKKNVTCNGLNNGEATIIIEGGFPPYTFVWNTSPVQTLPNAKKLNAGTYIVKATDKLGHSFIEEVIITEPAELVANSMKINNSLFGLSTGRAIAGVSGGTGIYQYSWNTSPEQITQEINELEAGNYVVTVKDENNCVASSNVEIIDSVVDINASIYN